MPDNICQQIQEKLSQLINLKSRYEGILAELAGFDFPADREKGKRLVVDAYGVKQNINDLIKAIEVITPVSIEKAREIMGEDFYGPEEAKKAFYSYTALAVIELVETGEETAPLPFTVSELRNAKIAGAYLIYRFKDYKIIHASEVASFSFTNPLNADYLSINDVGIKGREKEAPREGWALVFTDNLFLIQKSLIDALDEAVYFDLEKGFFIDRPMPKAYREAIEEYRNIRDQLKELLDRLEFIAHDLAGEAISQSISSNKEYEELLESLYKGNPEYQEKNKEFMSLYSKLKLPGLIMSSPEDLLYDKIVAGKSLQGKKGERPDVYFFTSAMGQDRNNLIYVTLEQEKRGEFFDDYIVGAVQKANLLLSLRPPSTK